MAELTEDKNMTVMGTVLWILLQVPYSIYDFANYSSQWFLVAMNVEL